jgi:hypothetical protein
MLAATNYSAQAAAAKRQACVVTETDRRSSMKKTRQAPRLKVVPVADTAISSQDRRRMIAEAAYFHAERRGFEGGSPDEDWYRAEREIDELLAKYAPAEKVQHPH